jgi:hypothetical protein
VYCWYCGTKLPVNAGFCFSCGKSQTEDALETTDPAGPASSHHPLPTTASPLPPPPAPRIATPLSDWRSPPEVPPGPTPSAPNRVGGYLRLGAAVLVIVGSFAPWVSVSVFFGTIQVNGMDGDGKVTIWCGLGAAALLAFHLFSGSHPAWPPFLAACVFLLSGIIGTYDWSNINDLLEASGQEDLDFGVLARVGWGLQVMTIASFVGTFFAGLQGFTAVRR